MALLDLERNLIVIRLVYDGPALSGKTTSLQSLAGALGRGLYSADQASGRTLYFDWLDYTGGRFEGYPIRCQVVSVPGQRSLRPRRQRILETADAVVFVADSRSGQLGASQRTLAALRETLATMQAPAPGVVVQANRRDAPDRAPMAEVRACLGGDGASAVTESVAVNGSGIRETFVLAVRLALDRVRALKERSALPIGRPEIDEGAALLDSLRLIEEQAEPEPQALGALALAEALACAGETTSQPAAAGATVSQLATREATPWLPRIEIASGMIWPPIGGRIVLHEALAGTTALEALADGSWTAVSAGTWRLHTFAHHVFAEMEPARRVLVDWARWHTGVTRLSERRCVLAVEGSANEWRLWQIVRGERTLRSALLQALQQQRPDAMARGLLDTAVAFAEGASALQHRGLQCSLDTLGLTESGVTYVGLVPGVGQPSAGAGTPMPEAELVRLEFGPALEGLLGTHILDVPRVLHHLGPVAAARGHEEIAGALATCLIGH